MKWNQSLMLMVAIAVPVAAPSGAAEIGTAFTYQGVLTESSSPANNPAGYDFQFTLWRDATSMLPADQIGTALIIDDQPVTDGQFTVKLDFGASAYNGQARWLGVAVRPGDDAGAYTALAPRQELTPTPHALALPGFFTRSNATSPNILGGAQGPNGNSIFASVFGGTIGGGGTDGFANLVTDHYGVVAGGRGNRAGDFDGDVTDAAYSTVAGGAQNTASHLHASVGGGFQNTANGEVSTIAGGQGNQAPGKWATIAGGVQNIANGGLASTVGGCAPSTCSPKAV